MSRKLVEKIRLTALSLVHADKEGDTAAVAKWAARLAGAAGSLADEIDPPVPPEPKIVLPPTVVGPPPTGDIHVVSTSIYGDWASLWARVNFPEAYLGWPGAVDSIYGPDLIEKATAQGVLAQVCGGGLLGSPDGAYGDTGDWSLFSNLVRSNDGSDTVYIGGVVVGRGTGGWEFAKSLGLRES